MRVEMVTKGRKVQITLINAPLALLDALGEILSDGIDWEGKNLSAPVKTDLGKLDAAIRAAQRELRG